MLHFEAVPAGALGLLQWLSAHPAIAQKFPDHDPIIMIRCLSYFQDAEEDANPKSLRNLDWLEVKNRIAAAVKKLL